MHITEMWEFPFVVLFWFPVVSHQWVLLTHESLFLCTPCSVLSWEHWPPPSCGCTWCCAVHCHSSPCCCHLHRHLVLHSWVTAYNLIVYTFCVCVRASVHYVFMPIMMCFITDNSKLHSMQLIRGGVSLTLMLHCLQDRLNYQSLLSWSVIVNIHSIDLSQKEMWLH